MSSEKGLGGPSNTCMKTDEASSEEEKGRRRGKQQEATCQDAQERRNLTVQVGGPCSKKMKQTRPMILF